MIKYIKPLLQNIFSVTNENIHKIVKFMGLKIKFLNPKKVKSFYKDYQKLCNNYNELEENHRQLECKNKDIEESYRQLEYKYNNDFQNFLWNGIVDSSPNSFKEYFLQNNIVEKSKILKQGLDEKSIKIIDKTLLKILQLPDYKYAQYLYTKNDDFIKRFSTESDIEYTNLEKQILPESKKTYKLSKNDYDAEVFVYHHGLKFANDKIKEYISGKDFIDAGAYIGDSAIVLLNYNPSIIYSFEISPTSISNYIATMKLNNVSETKYKINKFALMDKKDSIYVDDNGGMSVKIFNEDGEKVDSVDLDSYVKENNLNVGFIKADLEGSMYKALLGMKKTIKDFRPVLSFAIYHSPEEFFETKPLLDKIVENLNYKIEIDCHYSSCMHIYGTIIWAYPKELEC